MSSATPAADMSTTTTTTIDLLKNSGRAAQLAWIFDTFGKLFESVPESATKRGIVDAAETSNVGEAYFDSKRADFILATKNIAELVMKGIVFCQTRFGKLQTETNAKVARLQATKQSIEKDALLAATEKGQADIKKMSTELTKLSVDQAILAEFARFKQSILEILQKTLKQFKQKPGPGLRDLLSALENHFSGNARLILQDKRPKKKVAELARPSRAAASAVPAKFVFSEETADKDVIDDLFGSEPAPAPAPAAAVELIAPVAAAAAVEPIAPVATTVEPITDAQLDAFHAAGFEDWEFFDDLDNAIRARFMPDGTPIVQAQPAAPVAPAAAAVEPAAPAAAAVEPIAPVRRPDAATLPSPFATPISSAAIPKPVLTAEQVAQKQAEARAALAQSTIAQHQFAAQQMAAMQAPRQPVRQPVYQPMYQPVQQPMYPPQQVNPALQSTYFQGYPPQYGYPVQMMQRPVYYPQAPYGYPPTPYGYPQFPPRQ